MGARNGVLDGTAVAVAGTADPVCGLCGLATGLASAERPRNPIRVLETATRESADCGPPFGPAAPFRAKLPRRDILRFIPRRSYCSRAGFQPTRRGDAVHDAVGSVQCTALSLHRPGRHPAGLSLC